MATNHRLRAVLFRRRIDPYIIALLATVALASLLPASGTVAEALGHGTTVAIALLFFLYGARLSTRQAMDGLRHWRLHSVILISTFVLFPLLGLAARPLAPAVLTTDLYTGVMFLCCLPSTVQSSIAFTSIARGNVPVAICAASFSNLIGVFVTPLLVAAFLFTSGSGSPLTSVRDVMLLLLAPFVAGQLARRWLAGFVQRHKKLLGLGDRGVILLVVYSAFSEGVVAGIWQRLKPETLLALLAVNLILLVVVLAATTIAARKLRFTREDEIAIVFCGSKKSLATGLPMATVLFPAQTVSMTVLPLMLFHQIQLIACAALARRYAARADQTATDSAIPDAATSGLVADRSRSLSDAT